MKSLFKGPDGKISMMRFLNFFVCAIIMSVFAAHNIVSMTKGGGFVSIGESEAILLIGVIGAKAAQAFSEKKKEPKKLPDSVMPVANGE